MPCVWGRARDVRSLNREHAATGEPQDTETVLCGSGRGRWKRASNGTSPAAYVIALPHHRRCLIRLVHREPAPVAHRQPLLHEVPLRWPRETSRDDVFLAHSLCQRSTQPWLGLGSPPETPPGFPRRFHVSGLEEQRDSATRCSSEAF